MLRTFVQPLVVVLSIVGAVTASERPHIVLMMADDLGWGDVGYHGGKIATPHIDQLSKRGVRLNQFYVQPVCSPTRGALLTGRYPMRLGLQCGVVRPWASHGLPLDGEVEAEDDDDAPQQAHDVQCDDVTPHTSTLT